MAGIFIGCQNGRFFVHPRLFWDTGNNPDSLPVSYRAFERSEPAVQNVLALLEQYVGDFEQRMGLLDMVRHFCVGRTSRLSCLYSLCGFSHSGKKTFLGLLESLLGDFIAPIPRQLISDGQSSREVIEAVEDLGQSSVRVVWTDQMPDCESTYGIVSLMQRGVNVLFLTDEDDQYWNESIQPYVNPPIFFDASFVAPSNVNTNERLFERDPQFRQRLDGLVQAFLWVICNLSETEL